MGEIVSPAIAKLRELGEQSSQARLRELGEQPTRTRLGVPGEQSKQAGFKEPGIQTFRGSLRDVGALVPEFERRPFGEAQCHGASEQPHLDVLVRPAGPGVGLIEVPVGVVTRRHPLAPHARVIQAIERSISATRANPAEARCELELSAFGASMILSVDLPDRFDFDPGDGERLGLRLLCLNEVTGGGPRLLLSWHRQVSSSLIPVGTTRLEFRLAPRLALRIGEVAPAMRLALERAQAERAELAVWRDTLLTRDRLVKWADGAVRRVWGPRAAARVFHIAMSGWDAEPAYGFERVPPSRRTMRASRQVAAAPAFAESVYDVLLAAAWVANSGRGAGEHFDRIVEIALLMRALLRRERGQ